MNERDPVSGKLDGANVVRSSAGFGCARLVDISDRKERLALLNSALDAGIFHFDTAPMYGYGNSERELGEFVRGRREGIILTTKFGIEPTVLGRQVGSHRRFIRTGRTILRRTGLAFNATRSESIIALSQEEDFREPPTPGIVDRVLNKRVGYAIDVATKSLDLSLRSLKTDYVDCLLLHDPFRDVSGSLPLLSEYLEEERKRGRIRTWGLSGVVARDLAVGGIDIPVRQFRDDIWDPSSSPQSDAELRITYGSIGRLYPALKTIFQNHPSERSRWEKELGIEMTSESLASVLFQGALFRNVNGVVLFSTTKLSHLLRIARVAAGERTPNVTESTLEDLVHGLRQRVGGIEK